MRNFDKLKVLTYQPSKAVQMAKYLQYHFGGKISQNLWEKKDFGSFRYFSFEDMEIARSSAYFEKELLVQRQASQRSDYCMLYFSIEHPTPWKNTDKESKPSAEPKAGLFFSNQDSEIYFPNGYWYRQFTLRVKKSLMVEALGPKHSLSKKILNDEPYTIEQAVSDEMRALSMGLLEQMNGALAYYQAKAKAYELLVMFVKQITEGTLAIHNEKAPPLLDDDKMDIVIKAKELMVENYLNPPSQYELSRECGISETMLRKMFKQVFHTSMYQFIKDYRLTKAKNMLETTDWPINVVGQRVGYVHMGQFSAAIKKKFGVGPKGIKAGLLEEKEAELVVA